MQDLVNDAATFLTQNAVVTMHLARPGSEPTSPFYSILEKKKDNVYEVGSSQNTGQYTKGAYYLKYKPISMQGNAAEFVDIPKTPAENKLLFTGELSGCALIVVNLNNTTYRVYHDSRPLSSAFYKDVVMAADLIDYMGSNEMDPTQVPATVFLQYKGGVWTLYAQLLQPDGDSRVVRKSSSILLSSVFLRRPSEYQRPPIEYLKRKAESGMEGGIRLLNADITHFPPAFHKLRFDIPDARDGDFVPWEGNQATLSTNPAVARLRALREALFNAQKELNAVDPSMICDPGPS
jgi:hypothetical protein